MEETLLATLFGKPRIKDPVKRAATLARPPVPQPELIDRLLREAETTTRHLKQYLPVESYGRKEAEDSLAQKQARILAEQRVQDIVSEVGSRWQILDPQILKWCNAYTRMPTFGVFPVETVNGECSFTGEWDVNYNLTPAFSPEKWTHRSNLPAIYQESYRNVEAFLGVKARQIDKSDVYRAIRGKNFMWGKITLQLTARFAGVIPPNVRDEIALAQKVGLKGIAIVAEVPQWTYSAEISADPASKIVANPSKQGDPLVIGHDGSQFWLISVFDTTSIEQLVADEFALKP